jgi:hypothetical protein
MEVKKMADDEKRLDFLTYYRSQLLGIVEKLDRQIEKLGGNAAPRKEDEKPKETSKPKPDVEEIFKDLTDRQFLETFVEHEGVIEALEEFRSYFRKMSDEQVENGLLYYSNDTNGRKFAMLAASPRWINLYIAPKLGVYDGLPQEAWEELHFGKSQGDRWDKFKITSAHQAKKALSYLRGFIGGNGSGKTV